MQDFDISRIDGGVVAGGIGGVYEEQNVRKKKDCPAALALSLPYLPYLHARTTPSKGK